MNPLPVGSFQAVVRLQNGEIHTIANGAHVAVVDGGFTVRRTGVGSMIGVGNDLWVQTSTGFIRTQNGVPTAIISQGFQLMASRDGGIWTVVPGPTGPTANTFVGGGFVSAPTPMCMINSLVALGATALVGCADYLNNNTQFYEVSPLALPRPIGVVDAGVVFASGSDESNLIVWLPPFFSRRFLFDGGTSPSGLSFTMSPTFRVSSDGQLLYVDGTSSYRYTGLFGQAITPSTPGLKAIDVVGDAWAAVGATLRAGSSVPSFGQALTTSQTTSTATPSRLFRRPDGGVAMLHDFRVYSVSASGVVLESVYPPSLPDGRVTSMADGRALLAHVAGVSVLNPDGGILSFPGGTSAFGLPDNRIVAVGNVAQPRLVRIFNPDDGGVTSFDGGGFWTWAASGTSPSTVTLMAFDQLGLFDVQSGAVTTRPTPNMNFQYSLCVDDSVVYVRSGSQLFSSRDGGVWSIVAVPSSSTPLACGFGSVAQVDSSTISATAPTRSATFAATSVEVAPGGVVFAAGQAGEVVIVR